MDKKRDEWIDRLVDRQMIGQIDDWINRQIMDKLQIDRQIIGQIDR